MSDSLIEESITRPILEWTAEDALSRRDEIITEYGKDLVRALGVGCNLYIAGHRDRPEAQLFVEYDQLTQVIDKTSV